MTKALIQADLLLVMMISIETDLLTIHDYEPKKEILSNVNREATSHNQ